MQEGSREREGKRRGGHGLRVQHDCDRTVVDERDLHPRAEDTAGDTRSIVRHGLAEGVVQRLRLSRIGCAREARAVSLAGVGDERELTDDQRLARDVEERAVEAAALVLEDPEPCDLAGERPSVLLAVAGGDAEQHDDTGPAGADHLTLDRDRGFAHPLHDRTHRRIVRSAHAGDPTRRYLTRMEAAHQPWPKFGSLLVRDGLITEEELALALDEQRESGKRLGEILVDKGTITRAQVARLLAEQVEMPLVDLDESEVDSVAAALLPEDLARRYSAMPVGFLPDDSLLVAVADPTNVLHWDELRLALGVPIRFGIAAPDAIDAAIAFVHQESLDLVDETEESHANEVAGIVDMHELEGDAPAVAQVNKTIQRALSLGASDIHFTPQLRALEIRARVDGVVRRIGSIPNSQQAAVTSRLKVMGRLDIAERRAPQDGRVAVRTGGHTVDLRIAVLPTKFGEKITLRVLNQASTPRSLAELDLASETEDAIQNAIGQPFGAVITCGPTGSGKTTTLYAALHELNTPERTIMTIEDPVEYLTAGIDQIEVNPRAGLTFARGLRTILRSDPDVILVGEIRDEETAQIAIRAAMTGHLVCSTLHSQTAASAVRRLTDMGVEPGLLAATLTCLVAQRLARRICLECKETYKATKAELVALGRPNERAGRRLLARGAGCSICGGTGYKGRVALFEVLTFTEELRELIAGGASTVELQRSAVAAGMRPLREDGVRLCLEGVTTLSEVRRVVGDPP